MYKLAVTSRTNATTLSIDDVKLHLKVEYNEDDVLINKLIFSAFDYFENATGIVLYPKKYRLRNTLADAYYEIPLTPLGTVTALTIDTEDLTADIETMVIDGQVQNQYEADITLEFSAGSDTFDNQYFNIISELVAYWYEFRNSEKLPDYLQQKINGYIKA